MSSQGYEEELLQRWFPATSQLNERTQFSETDIRGITDVLRTVEGGAWSRIPRIYIVLRLIGRLEAISSFIQHECSDTWFPFTQRNLPEGLRDPSERSGFLERQKLVCNTKALNLERADSRHGHFPDPSEIPLKKIGELGKGGSGFVDRVISTVSHREYALKLIKRGQTFRKDKQILRNFEKELANLKRLSREHKHIIDLVGSYTDPKYVGILFPVADCDLTAFMVSPDIQERRWSIRPYFGCLVSALVFLHENNIRHKDIKPQNILIKDNVPCFTDFGLAVDWTDFGHSTTLGPTAMTPRYGAPEVAACEARNSSADIWSLGCVFLEMWAVLKGMPIEEVSASTSVDRRLLPYHSKDVRLSELMQRITALPGPPSDLQPLTWIRHMLLRERHGRWSAHAILEHIRELGADDTIQYLFVGRCCFEDEDTAESVVSYASSHHEDVLVTKSKVAGVKQSVQGPKAVLTSELPRPPPVRRRQSMQIIDLQAQLDQLQMQNRALEEAKVRAEESLFLVQKQKKSDKDNDSKNSIGTSFENYQANTDLEKAKMLSRQKHPESVTSRPGSAAHSEEIHLSREHGPSIPAGSPKVPKSERSGDWGLNTWGFPERKIPSIQRDSSNTLVGPLPSATDGESDDLHIKRPESAPIADHVEGARKTVSYTYRAGLQQSPSQKVKPPVKPPVSPGVAAVTLAERPVQERLRLRQKDFLKTAKAYSGQKPTSETDLRFPVPPPPPPPPPPIRLPPMATQRHQSYAGSSTEAYSSMSDTPRTSKPRSTTRSKPARKKPTAPEKGGFFGWVEDRLRPDAKGKASRSGQREKSSRDQSTTDLGWAKPVRDRPDDSHRSKPRRLVVPDTQYKFGLPGGDSRMKEERPRRQQPYPESPDELELSEDYIREIPLHEQREDKRSRRSAGFRAPAPGAASNYKVKKRPPRRPPSSSPDEDEAPKRDSKPVLGRNTTYVY